nr:Hsp70 family protein [Chloroflexia bacterium]
ADNKSLGRFILDGIPASPRGVPKIEVTFDIDANGILNVAAKDSATNKEQKITITGSSGLSNDEVERMVQEAESHAEEDKARREAIDTRNQAESFVFQAEKTLEDYGDKIDSETKAELDTKIAAVKDILENDRENIDRLKPAHDELVETLQKASTAMYEAAAAAGAEGQPGDMGGDPFGGNGAQNEAATADDDTTVEGEFREVGADDEKKQS